MITTVLCVTLFSLGTVYGSDITDSVFGKTTDGMPAAFGDFNSDELTDVFVLRNDEHTVEILLAAEEEPLLRAGNLHCNFTQRISSVVPGDFDGDAFMDILITTIGKEKNEEGTTLTDVHIIWGGADHLNCTDELDPILRIQSQPLAIDYNQDMIIDLFGVNRHGQRVFWIFNKMRTEPREIIMHTGNENYPKTPLRYPHSHAFLDLNEDFMADLFLTTERDFEIWLGHEDAASQQGFTYDRSIPYPGNFHPSSGIIGQSSFMDIELRGRMDLITPFCFDVDCRNSTILVYANNAWQNLQINFKDKNNNAWRFVKHDGQKYTDTITLRSGDFNMDGYPDLLATLQSNVNDEKQAFLLENVPCDSGCGNFKRTFAVRWNALYPFRNGSVMAVFYDFYQDGILDVILVQMNKTEKSYRTAAFKNSLDYDANFIKVMVLTGLTNKKTPTMDGRIGKKRRTYGTNLPGPRILYHTTTQEGIVRRACSAQLPQSAFFSLDLPYTIFGLGRTPNFVDTLTVGLSNRSREWTQIIPNSQMVVIPWPVSTPAKWKAQLFVTPSKLILMSVASLTGVCGLITIIIGVLYWKERQEDKKERLQESHRFHFDAM